VRRAAIAILLLMPLLGGCWGSNEAQTLAYATAIGIDYADGKYKVYAQILNFANVAKLESSEPGKNVPVWIGHGTGTTMFEAITDLYGTSQLRLYWGHVSAVVITEGVIAHNKLREVTDTLNRYREIRYNVQVFGTKEPLAQILSVKSLLNFSPLESLLARPAKYYTQRPYIVPILGFKFIANMNEPGYSAFLPSLGIDKQSWKEDSHNKPMFSVTGSYFFNAHSYVGWMSEKELIGVRWVHEQMDRAAINVPHGEKPIAVINLHGLHYDIRPVVRERDVAFNISIRLKGSVGALWGDVEETELARMAEAGIADEVRRTFERAVGKKIDVYRLTQQLYRDNPTAFKRLMASRPFPLTKDSLDRVDVHVRIVHSGKFKGK
jgi:spore germination protein KC